MLERSDPIRVPLERLPRLIDSGSVRLFVTLGDSRPKKLKKLELVPPGAIPYAF